MLITWLITMNPVYSFLIDHSVHLIGLVMLGLGIYHWRFATKSYTDEQAISQAYFIGKWGSTK